MFNCNGATVDEHGTIRVISAYRTTSGAAALVMLPFDLVAEESKMMYVAKRRISPITPVVLTSEINPCKLSWLVGRVQNLASGHSG